MDLTTAPSDTITCAKPGCDTLTTLAESTYIDGCGQVCPGCDGPLPAWWDDLKDIELPLLTTVTVLTGRARIPVSTLRLALCIAVTRGMPPSETIWNAP